MSDDGSDGLSTADRIARLQGVRNYLEDQEFEYLDLTGVYGSDPLAKSPYVVQGTFIPEEIGGTVTVIDADDDEGSTLAQENLNQMLNNFLPGGYKQRWGDFDLWRGAWHHDSEPEHADIGPMCEWRESFPLTDLLGDVSDVAYTELSFDPEDVRVYVPLSIRVTKENKDDPEYVWIPHKGIVWTGDPPMRSEPLSSDPTTNYLWFKHIRGSFEEESEPLPASDLIDGFAFDDEREFVRCYYASLLTLYPRDSQETRSAIIKYRSEADDTTAFVASEERSVSPIVSVAAGGSSAARTVLVDVTSNAFCATRTANRTAPVRVKTRLAPSATASVRWRAIGLGLCPGALQASRGTNGRFGHAGEATGACRRYRSSPAGSPDERETVSSPSRTWTSASDPAAATSRARSSTSISIAGKVS